MRRQVMAWLVATAFAGAAFAAYKPSVRMFVPPPPIEAGGAASRPLRILTFSTLTAQLDNHVIANLLTDIPLRQNELPLTVVGGEVTRCESQTCTVPLTVRVSGTEGPVMLAIAVANAKGQLSEVRHSECGTGSCGVALVLERGYNTISIGAVDALSQTTAYTTLRVNAARAVAQNRKSEWF
jgi:hypothetical protein